MHQSLKKVLKIREAREAKAIAATSQARNFVQQCELQKQQVKHELDQYYTWRIDQEKLLYAELQHQSVGTLDLQDYQAKVSGIWEQEANYLQKISELEQQLVEAEENLRLAKEQLMKMQSAKEKMTELVSTYSAEEQKKQEALEEQEFEEFNDTAFSRR